MKLCVILPVYNAEKYLLEALQSLSNQTFKNFKILAINDYSTDTSGAILEKYAKTEPRMEVVHMAQNSGECGVMNFALERLENENFEFIARMDSDDICHPFRFVRQTAFFRKNPTIHIVGTNSVLIDEHGNETRSINLPATDALIKANLAIATSNIYNPTAMWRHDWFRKNHIRFGDTRVAGDYAMWVECALKGANFANLSEPLFKYRIHGSQLSKNMEVMSNAVQSILERYMARILPQLSAQEITDLTALCHANSSLALAQVKRAFAVFEKIKNEHLSPSVLGENRTQLMINIENRLAPWKQYAD